MCLFPCQSHYILGNNITHVFFTSAWFFSPLEMKYVSMESLVGLQVSLTSEHGDAIPGPFLDLKFGSL